MNKDVWSKYDYYFYLADDTEGEPGRQLTLNEKQTHFFQAVEEKPNSAASTVGFI